MTPWCPSRKESDLGTDRGAKPGSNRIVPSTKGIPHMRRHLIALYVAGATVASLVAANGALAATWIRR